MSYGLTTSAMQDSRVPKKIWSCVQGSTLSLFSQSSSYLGTNSVEYARYNGPNHGFPPLLVLRRQNTELVFKTHSILDNLGIEHWLMYGSLRGSLRGFEGPLP